MLGTVLAVALAAEAATFWAPADPPIARYQIDCEISAEQRSLQGSETIRFVNTGRWPLQRLALDWRWTDASPIEIRADGAPVALPESVKDASPLVFDLPEPVAPGKAVTLEVSFRRGWSFEPYQGYQVMSSWYPRVVWGSRQADDFAVRIRGPAGYKLLTTGALDKTGVWRGTRMRQFSLIFSKDLLSTTREAGGVLITALHTEKGAECAKVVLDAAADIIPFYESRFGFYPHASLNILPGMDRPAGGYPASTATVVIHGQERLHEKPPEHWKWVTAHEIGHQYWFEHVLAEGEDSLPWLLLGLGIYVDREYSRERGLTSKHTEFLSTYMSGVREGRDTTLDRTAEQFNALEWDTNNIVEHGKGYAVISALDVVLGPAMFDRLHRRALNEFAGRRLSWKTFQKLAEEESGQDLDWFFDQWVRSNVWLSYDITGRKTERAGEQYVTSVQVKRLGKLEMPMPVEAELEDGTRLLRTTDRLLREQTIEFRTGSPVKHVRLDPAGLLPNMVPPPTAGAEEISEQIRKLPWSGAAERAKALYPQAMKVRLLREGEWFKLGLNLYDGLHYAEALEAFRAGASQALSRHPLTQSLVWQGHVLDLLNRRDEAVEAYRKAAASCPPGFDLRHDQWRMRIDRQWIEQRMATRFERPEPVR